MDVIYTNPCMLPERIVHAILYCIHAIVINPEYFMVWIVYSSFFLISIAEHNIYYFSLLEIVRDILLTYTFIM